jgi:uncharacterized hydrophobic protein (TIGR00271 family)
MIQVNLKEQLTRVLEPYKVRPRFFLNDDGSTWQVVFVTSERTEELLRLLAQFGLGVSFGSISILPVELSRTALTPEEMQQKQTVKAKEKAASQSMWNTVKSRLLLERVISDTRQGAQFTFDFLFLTIVASLLSGVGLAANNTVVIVASMLVSPLMGPILAVTFSSSIRDWNLFKLGMWSEVKALGVCLLTGFVLGLCFAPFGERMNFPTLEMSSRGTGSGLVLGICIAIPSGIGVALSVLGDNTASLVGVAISAALLPPIVNTGVLFAYALCGPWFGHTDPQGVASIDRLWFVQMGAVSFALCMLNILCIYAMAVLMFWIKEVAPVTAKSSFWHHLQIHARSSEKVRAGAGGAAAAAAGGYQQQRSGDESPPSPTMQQQQQQEQKHDDDDDGGGGDLTFDAARHAEQQQDEKQRRVAAAAAEDAAIEQEVLDALGDQVPASTWDALMYLKGHGAEQHMQTTRNRLTTLRAFDLAASRTLLERRRSLVDMCSPAPATSAAALDARHLQLPPGQHHHHHHHHQQYGAIPAFNVAATATAARSDAKNMDHAASAASAANAANAAVATGGALSARARSDFSVLQSSSSSPSQQQESMLLRQRSGCAAINSHTGGDGEGGSSLATRSASTNDVRERSGSTLMSMFAPLQQ